jgi:hypothetical protein
MKESKQKKKSAQQKVCKLKLPPPSMVIQGCKGFTALGDFRNRKHESLPF